MKLPRIPKGTRVRWWYAGLSHEGTVILDSISEHVAVLRDGAKGARLMARSRLEIIAPGPSS